MSKKFFLPIVLTVLLVQFIIAKYVHAQDVWVCNESRYKVYAMTETYGRYAFANFYINAKLVYPDGTYSTNKYTFIREQQGGRFNVTWYCKVNDSDSYKLDLDNPENNAFPYHVSLYRFCVKNFQ